MSLASSSPACSRRPAGAGCAQSARLPLPLPLLLLLLLTPSWHQVEAGPINAVVARELRCTCLHTSPRVHPRMIKRLQVTPAGPHCSKVEVIAFLKNQNTVCLDPEAPWMKKVLEKMLDSSEIRKTSDQPSGTTF